MNFDLFLTSPRWEILQIIAEKPSSPVEIAEKLKTTVSYVSQQLKLLDAANLLNKEKTGSVEKGKPRTLFSLSNELLYITLLTKKITGKKLIHLTDYHKTILKIWLLDDSSYHQSIEKVFFKLEDDLKEIDAIFIDSTNSKPRFIVVSESKKLRQGIEDFIKKIEKPVEMVFVNLGNLKKYQISTLVSLHDPKNLLEKLKGGGI
jgi:predicted transcriptional regulator